MADSTRTTDGTTVVRPRRWIGSPDSSTARQQVTCLRCRRWFAPGQLYAVVGPRHAEHIGPCPTPSVFAEARR